MRLRDRRCAGRPVVIHCRACCRAAAYFITLRCLQQNCTLVEISINPYFAVVSRVLAACPLTVSSAAVLWTAVRLDRLHHSLASQGARCLEPLRLVHSRCFRAASIRNRGC